MTGPAIDLDFLLDVVTTGTVHGLEPTAGPGEVAARLGGDGGAVSRARGRMWADHGTVRFFWERDAAGTWRGTHLTLPAWDLPTPIAFSRLARAAAGRGCPLTELPAAPGQAGAGADEREAWQPDTRVAVRFRAAADQVHSVYVPLPPEAVAARHHDARERASAKDGLRHLLSLPEAERAAWVASRCPPLVLGDAARWFWYRLLLTDVAIREQPGKRAWWVELQLWLIRRAGESGAFGPVETATRTAYAVHALWLRGWAGPLLDVGVLPSADAVVRGCLAALPPGRDPHIQTAPLAGMPVEDLRRSRRARQLIRAAEPHLPRLRDPLLAAELRQWLQLAPLMV